VGASRDQLLHQNYHQIESWKESGVYAAATSAGQEKKKTRLEAEVTTTLGRTLNVDCHFVPFTVAGAPHTLLMMEDVTARKEMERNLAESENRLKSFINNFPGIAFVSDPGKCVLLANDGLADLYGMTAAHV